MLGLTEQDVSLARPDQGADHGGVELSSIDHSRGQGTDIAGQATGVSDPHSPHRGVLEFEVDPDFSPLVALRAPSRLGALPFQQRLEQLVDLRVERVIRVLAAELGGPPPSPVARYLRG